MKPKRIEFVLFVILVLSISLRLLGYSWIDFIIYLNYFGLISIWVIGYLKRKTNIQYTFDKHELNERLIISIFVLGLILTTTETNYSDLLVALGLAILFITCIIKGIQKLMKKDLLTSFELLIISVIFLGYFLRFRFFSGSFPLRVLGITLLVCLYIVMGINFIIQSSKNKKTILGLSVIFAYLNLGIYLAGILFDTMFWPWAKTLLCIALIGSILIITLFIFQFFRKDEYINIQRHQLNNLLKRFILIFSISVFLGISTPKQYLRFCFGNRPQLIDSYYNCQLNNEMENVTRRINCEEFKHLNEVFILGLYPDGEKEIYPDLAKKIYEKHHKQ